MYIAMCIDAFMFSATYLATDSRFGYVRNLKMDLPVCFKIFKVDAHSYMY